MLWFLAAFCFVVAASSAYAGLRSGMHAVTQTHYPAAAVLFAIAAVFALAGIGLVRRSPWARHLALALCMFVAGAILAATGAAIYLSPMRILSRLGWPASPGWMGSNAEAAVPTVVAALTVPTALYFVERAWNYLKSDGLRIAFGERTDPLGRLAPESVGPRAVALALVLGILALLPLAAMMLG